MPCSLCPGRGHWITHNRRPVFVHAEGSCKSDLPRLVQRSYRAAYQSFTHPTRCGICGRACFFYQNENGSKVFFDSLGPPWPKHSCYEESTSLPPYWKSQGFTPVHLLDAIPDPRHQTLTLQVKLLPSGQRLALRLKDRRAISQVRAVIMNPFHLKEPSGSEEGWLLSTFEFVGEGIRPKTFRCEKTFYQELLLFTPDR